MEQIPERNSETSIEQRLLEVKVGVQATILAEILGGNEEQIQTVLLWIHANGETVNTFFQENPELLDLYESDPNEVLLRVKKKLQGTTH